MFKANARYFILGALVLLLIGAGYLNYHLNTGNTDQANAGVTPTAAAENAGANAAEGAGQAQAQEEQSVQTQAQLNASFFATYRQERETGRAKTIEYLDSIINNKASDKDALKEAQQEKISIAKRIEQEVAVEGLIKAKGLSDAVVTIYNGAVNVVVGEAEITKEQAAQILEVVTRETGQSAKNVKILPKGN